MRGSLALRRLSTADELRALAPEWKELWTRCNASPFQRPEWLLPWLESFCPSELWVLEAREIGRLVGVAPMFIYQRGDERVLVPIGAGITDYLDWLVEPGWAESCVPAIVAELQTAAWDALECMDLPGNSPLLKTASHKMWKVEACDTCPALHFGRGTPINEIVPPHQRRNLKTARNRISRVGSWKIETAHRDTLPEFLDTLFRLHANRWTELGEPGVLADPKIQRFHTHAAVMLLDSGLLRFYGIRFEGRLIAALHTLIGRNALYCYMQGFDTAYAEFSPGMLVLEAALQDAVREGKSCVDFLRGREKYKYAWGAQDEPTFRIRVTKSAQVADPAAYLAA